MGDKRRDIFIEDRDRKLFLDTIGETSERLDERIGQLFGVSYSAVSHIIRDVKQLIKKDPRVRSKASRINSQFKM